MSDVQRLHEMFRTNNNGKYFNLVLIVSCFFNLVTRTTPQGQAYQSNPRKIRAITHIYGEQKFSWVEKVKKKDAAKYLSNPLSKNLRRIGLFLAAHKYFEVDRRYVYTTAQKEKRVFYKHFPIPRLRKRHPAVVNACDRGFIPCVEEIFKKANMSGSLVNIHKNFGNKQSRMTYPSYHPFEDTLELFRYRVTASYYMCWYTELREEPLAFPDTYPCFTNLEKTTEAASRTVVDFRSNLQLSMFTCSYLWFCPDPCYGKSSKGDVKSESVAIRDEKNPCGVLKDKRCIWKTGKNKNFDDLIKNRFNYSCNCEAETKGFIWTPMFSVCVDRDECYEGKYSCPADKICRNTVGSYMCTCRRGFYFERAINRCKRRNLLSVGAVKALKKKQKGKAVGKKSHDAGYNILKLLVEMVRGQCSRPFVSKVFFVTCITIMTLTYC